MGQMQTVHMHANRNTLEPGQGQIVQRIQHGDKAAFEKLFRTYSAPLCHFALGYVRTMEVAEEIVQEVFLKIWAGRDCWQPRSIKSYLYGAVRNRALDYLKHRRVVRQWQRQARCEPQVAGGDPAGSLQYRELEEAVQEEIMRLPERCRQVFALSRHHSLTYKEIALVMGISVKTVETQMSRAFRILRKRLHVYKPA